MSTDTELRLALRHAARARGGRELLVEQFHFILIFKGWALVWLPQLGDVYVTGAQLESVGHNIGRTFLLEFRFRRTAP